jgi:flagellar basal-body rod protein FlgB
MKAIGAKVDYLYERQGVIAQNIANSDTPGYQSKDLTDVDFASVMKKLTGTKRVTLETTNPMHMPNPDMTKTSKEAKDRWTYEVAPDKNGVIIEEQMVKAAKTQMEYNLMTNLSSKYGMMYRTALGRNG